LILDEPITGLDARTEAKINAALYRLTQGKTTFIIAHKFSTIASADKVLMLEAGQLAYQGTHEQLLSASAQYRKLYELQLGQQQGLVAVETTAGESNEHNGPAVVPKSNHTMS
jgi:ABC-type multidrug transport system fused ATPase/permease subunit